MKTGKGWTSQISQDNQESKRRILGSLAFGEWVSELSRTQVFLVVGEHKFENPSAGRMIHDTLVQSISILKLKIK